LAIDDAAKHHAALDAFSPQGLWIPREYESEEVGRLVHDEFPTDRARQDRILEKDLRTVADHRLKRIDVRRRRSAGDDQYRYVREP
jgi:hypothetical protein